MGLKKDILYVFLAPFLVLSLVYITIPVHEGVHAIQVKTNQDLSYRGMHFGDSCPGGAPGCVKYGGRADSELVSEYETQAYFVQGCVMGVMFVFLSYLFHREKFNGGEHNGIRRQRRMDKQKQFRKRI